MTTPMTASDYAELAGKNLRRLMKEKDVTQAQLSHDLKISKGTVNSWVRGQRLPRAAAMDTLCRYLQCTRSDIMGTDPQELPQDVPQAVQEPLRDAEADDLKYVLDALDQAGLGRLEALVKAAVGVDNKTLTFVTGILQRNQQ